MAASKASKHAKALSNLGASKGGLARKEALSPEERRAIAKRAAQERWAATKGLPRETHTGTLKLGDGVPCSVLENEMRVFSVNGLLRAFGSGAKGRAPLHEGGPQVPVFLAAANIQPYISAELMAQLSSPIAYRAMHGGQTALGYEATIVRKMCDTLLDARAAGVLRLSQLPVARAAEVLVRAFADVGIIALIDEATGFQAERDRTALTKLLHAYVVPEMQPWLSKFPHEFFKQIHRLWGWKGYDEKTGRNPQYVGTIINDYIYGRMVQGLPQKLDEVNPVINGRRKHKHYRHLTGDTGIPHLDKQIASVTTLMVVSTDRPMFEMLLKKRFPKSGDQMELPTPPGDTEDRGGGEVVAEVAEARRRTATIDGVEISDAVGGVRERITAAMRGRDMISSKELAALVYGDNSEPTMNKLRIRLAQYKLQGLVATPRRGFWKLL